MLRKIKLFGIIALLAVAVVTVSSCGKDNKIVGKWKITSASGEFSDDKGEIWTFKDKGTCSIVIGGDTFDGEWSISKDNLTIDIDDREITITGDFSIDELKSKSMSLSGEWTAKYQEDDYYYYKSNSKYTETVRVKANYDFEKK